MARRGTNPASQNRATVSVRPMDTAVRATSCRLKPMDGLRRSRGFTLIELLAVMLIIGLVAVFIVPAASTILRGSQLTQAMQTVSDQLNLARQTALSKSHSVEVRFYQFGLTEAGEQPAQPATGKYRAMQLFEITDSGAVALGKMQRWPDAIMIDPAATYSTIMAPPAASASPQVTASGNQAVLLPGIQAYNSVSFRFLPDGSADLAPPAGPWFLTLHNRTDAAQPPANFVTIQVDAFNGYLRTFRP